MSKPHEEDWDNGRDFEVTVCGPELDRDIDAPREVMARAAPYMARALRKTLAMLEASSHAEECPVMDDDDDDGPSKQCVCMKGACEAEFRAALTKAGVLLP